MGNGVVEFLDREAEKKVYNWAFSRGLNVISYDWRNDTWLMSDGEPYTTTLILREDAEGENNAI